MSVQLPFGGIKMLGVTSICAAPFATCQLAMHGAKVINVEDPGVGDGVSGAWKG